MELLIHLAASLALASAISCELFQTFIQGCLFNAYFNFDLTLYITAPSRCVCTREYWPVCVAGKTYSNKCIAKCKNPRVPESHIIEGKCEVDLSCSCPRDYNPVCSKGQTFSNRCIARCALPRGSKIVKGKCKTS